MVQELTRFQPFFGAMGCTSAIVFTCFGAAYGTAKAGVGISAMGVLRPDLIVKSQYMMRAGSVRRIFGTRGAARCKLRPACQFSLDKPCYLAI